MSQSFGTQPLHCLPFPSFKLKYSIIRLAVRLYIDFIFLVSFGTSWTVCVY